MPAHGKAGDAAALLPLGVAVLGVTAVSCLTSVLPPISPTTPPCARSYHHSTPGAGRRWCMRGATSARAATRAGWRVPSAGHASCERWVGLRKHRSGVEVASTAHMLARQLPLPSVLPQGASAVPCHLLPCSAAACAGASRTPGKAATHSSSHPTAPRSPSTLRWYQPPRGSACGTSERELEGVRHTSQGMSVHGVAWRRTYPDAAALLLELREPSALHLLCLLRACRTVFRRIK